MINNKNFNRIEFEAFKKELSLLNAEAIREKVLFNKNNINPTKKLK